VGHLADPMIKTAAPSLYEHRAQRLSTALRQKLEALYGGDPQFEGWLGELLARVEAAAKARPATLQALDLAREASPDWFIAPDMLGYSAYLDRFAGGLTGLHHRIPYLRDLGVRYLHLLPFWKTPAGDSDGGFAVSDYGQVRDGLGDIEDLEPLASALRRADISLCVDLVLNHTASDHPWARAALRGDEQYRAYYHVIDDPDLVARYEANLPQIFPKTAPGNFTWVEPLGAHVWTTFYPFQWDLNWANPRVFGAFVDIILNLANRGVEAFRLDSAAFLWKRLGADCRSLPETHLILQALRLIVAMAAPGVVLKSEVIGPVAETAQFLGDADAPECHLTYHAGLMTAAWAALAEEDADMLAAVIRATPPLPPHTGWLTYVRCHDDIGWMSLAPQAGDDPVAAKQRLAAIGRHYDSGATYARGRNFQADDAGEVHGLNGSAAALAGLESARTPQELEAAIARLRLLYGLAFAAGGLPVIYMGDEYGQLNDYAYDEDPARAHEGRWLHRPRFDEAAARTVGAHSTAGQVRTALQALIAARRYLPALNAETAPAVEDLGVRQVLGLRRGARHLTLFNLSGEAQRFALPKGAWRDLLRPDDSGINGHEALRLAPYGMAWLEALDP
jgi:amylosucrase